MGQKRRGDRSQGTFGFIDCCRRVCAASPWPSLLPKLARTGLVQSAERVAIKGEWVDNKYCNSIIIIMIHG